MIWILGLIFILQIFSHVIVEPMTIFTTQLFELSGAGIIIIILLAVIFSGKPVVKN